MGISTNLMIVIVLFLLTLLFFWLLSRRASSGDANNVEVLNRDAERGDVYSQFKLGQMYFQGDGVQRDDVEAAKWFMKASQQDHTEAQYILATMYEKGTGVPRSEQEAFNLFSKAAFRGHERAVVILGSGKWDAYMHKRPVGDDILLEEPHLEEVPPAQEQKTDLEQKYLAKAEQGNVDAQYNLGIMYYHGEGVPKNHDEALHWFHLAAEQNDADAQYNLGFMYGKGEGTKKDQRQSLEWFQKAAAQGHAGAREILEKMFKKE